MNSRNPSIHRSDIGESIRPSNWKYGGICSTWISKGETQYDYLDGNWYKGEEKLIRHLDFQRDKMKDKVHKLDQYLLGEGPLKGTNKALWEKNIEEVF